MTRNIVILSGTQKQYEQFIRTNFKSALKKSIRYIFPHSEDQLRGLKINGMEIIGNFWDREDAKELHSYVVERISENVSKKEEKVDITN